MVASGIFLALLVLLLRMRRGSWRSTLVLFIAALVAIAILFNHHMTDSLGLSF